MPKHDLEKFITGFERFQQAYYGDDHELIESLTQAQHPRTFLVGCCDSRVDPAHLMGTEIGEMFVSRNVANLVPPCEVSDGGHHGVSAAIQFAVQSLQVERIIVLGHSRCGGIRALMDESRVKDPIDFISMWVSIAEPAKRQTLASFTDAPLEVKCRVCEQSSILNSLNNLMSFPWIREAVDAGRLSLHGWYFDLEAGELLAYSKRVGAFLPMVCALDSTDAKNAAR